MSQGLQDLTRHNSWANAQIFGYCARLDPAVLDETVPGTYGTIIATLRHTIASETSYLFRISGERPEPPQDWHAVGLAELTTRAAEVAAIWERFIAGEVDFEGLGEGHSDKGEVFAIPTGVFIAQALHHGSEHRAHVCTILGALGYEAPDVSAWGYATANGRERLISSPDGV